MITVRYNKKKNNYLEKNQAFTMIELLIVVGILGMLLAFLGPRVAKYMGQASVRKTEAKMNGLKNAVGEYILDIGHPPNKREGGLEALLEKPLMRGTEKWNGPYLSGQQEIPLDEWGNEFIYNVGTDIKNKKRYRYYEIISWGPDMDESDDDLFVGE